MKRRLLLLSFIVIFGLTNCSSQQNKEQISMNNNNELINRESAVAGSFYPGNKEELRVMLDGFFANAKPSANHNNIRALISPHAGYVFSGQIAASGFNQLNSKQSYDNIFIIASSHRLSFKGASIYNTGHYETPLGITKVNLSLSSELIKDNSIFTFNPEAHATEHSLEVQIPFLQYLFPENLQIVPILIGTQTPDDCMEIAQILKPWFNEKNLFIISSDFSHFPSYEDANLIDNLTANAIISNSPDELIKSINSVPKPINGLSTRLCGWSSVLTMLYITQDLPGTSIELVDYKNSGDIDIGDKQRVVGYNSLIITQMNASNNTKNNTQSDYQLSESDKETLLDLARKTIKGHLGDSLDYQPNTKNYSDNLLTECGAFVTLHKDGKLRGCIGRFEPGQALYKVVQEMAIAAATHDRRFSSVTIKELNIIEIEISVLTPLKKIDSIEEFIIKKHGIYIKKGIASGTFLPQVATETGWTAEEFLGHCSRDKAGIGWDGWKEADLFTYEAIIFSENSIK